MKLLLYILLLPFLSIAQTIDCGGNFNVSANKEFRINNVKTTHYSGFYDYNDSITSVIPIAYTTGSPLQLTNDAKGDQTLDTYKPYGCGQIWDTTTNTIDLTDYSLGDEFNIRISIDITTSSNNQEFRIYLLMSVGGYNYQLQNGNWFFKNSGTYQVESVIPFYIGNTQTRDYPAKIMFSSDANATIKVNGFYISVNRR